MLDYFLPFYPPNSPKNENFKKMKTMPGDVIILHKCTKNHDHMLYYSWDMVRDRCNYFSFWAIFCPFTPNSPTNENSKKMKKTPGILSFYTSEPKIMIMWYTVPEICCVRNVIIFSFWAIFLPFYPPNSSKNQNLTKLKKTPGDNIILHMCTKNYDEIMYGSW